MTESGEPLVSRQRTTSTTRQVTSGRSRQSTRGRSVGHGPRIVELGARLELGAGTLVAELSTASAPHVVELGARLEHGAGTLVATVQRTAVMGAVLSHAAGTLAASVQRTAVLGATIAHDDGTLTADMADVRVVERGATLEHAPGTLTADLFDTPAPNVVLLGATLQHGAGTLVAAIERTVQLGATLTHAAGTLSGRVAREVTLGATLLRAGGWVIDTNRFGANWELARLLDDGTVRQLTDDPSWHSTFPQVSPDARTIAFVRFPASAPHDPPVYTTASIWTMPLEGGPPTLRMTTTATRPPPAGTYALLATPHWSPTSARLVVATVTAGGAQIITTNATGGDPQVIDSAAADLSDPSWYPIVDVGGPNVDRVVYCSGGNIVRRDWNRSTKLPVGTRTPLLDHSIWWMYDPTYRPDGGKLAFLAEFAGKANGDWGIGVCGADGSNPQRITPADHTYSKPEWTPDGQAVVCHRFMGSGRVDVVQVPADGSAA